MIYDFTPSFVPKPRQSEKLIQKLNHHFSHTRSRFPSLLSHEKSEEKLSSKVVRTHLLQFHIDKSNPYFIERYHNDKYVRLLQGNPCKIMSQVFSLLMEIQEIIAMSYFNNQKSETWMLKFNESKVIVEIDAKEMWMELESKMSLVHLFHMLWPYHKPKISLNYVDHVNIKYWGQIISFTNVVNDLVVGYNTSSILIYDIIYDYTTHFSKTSCVDNVINTKPRFGRTYQQLDLRKKSKQEIYPK